jgi:GT2 family glycosyltransferase
MTAAGLPTPVASVVIPSFARPARLLACLEALAATRLDGPFEVVVVDDGSPEPLAPAVGGRDWPFRLSLHRQANAGPAAARNAGAAAARAPFLAFTDDDCLPAPGWIAGLMRAQAGDPARLVGGRIDNALPDNVYAAASQDLVDYLYRYFGADTGEAPFFTSNNIGCDRARFLGVGGFDRTFPLAAAEDREFGMRWREQGGSLVFAADAVVGHAHGLDLRRFWRQHSNYGRGARHLHRVREAGGQGRPPLERVGFYAGLVTFPLRDGGRRPIARSSLMFLSQLAMVAGYLKGNPDARHPA